MTASPSLTEAATVFDGARRRLFGLAYRMLGSAAEAEDVVQDAWLRWQGADRATVLDPTAFLVTTTTRLAINAAQSARARRETYVGPWLPEPVDTAADPELGATRGEALGIAVLLLLEKLAPAERAAYVLREAFDYDYARIAEVLETSEANVRQLVSRAKKHLEEDRKRPAPRDAQRRLLQAFVEAARRGDHAALETMLVADVVNTSDGGGIVRATTVPVHGREKVARFVAAYATTFWVGTTVSAIEVNGQPALAVHKDGALVTVVTLDASDDGIERVYWVWNPHKLATLAR